jgi:hypothetical protein
MTQLDGERGWIYHLKTAMKYAKQAWRADKKLQKKHKFDKIWEHTRPIIEPWTKKRKWMFFLLGTVAIVASGQVLSSGNIEGAAILFTLGSSLDILGLFLTERRIRYMEKDILSDEIGTGRGNLEKRVSNLEDHLERKTDLIT